MQKLRHSNSKGFTIIQVLIVLAIAGLIMVVVFLAVPALNRNSRNNALSTNANNIMSGVGTYVSNNNGTLPANVAAAAVSGGKVTIGATTGVNQEVVKVDSSVTNFSIVDAKSITTTSGIGAVQVVKKAQCNDTKTDVVTTGVSSRSYALLYVAEGSGGDILKCIDG